MTVVSSFWTPYRKGILVALLGWTSGLVAVTALFAMVLYRTEIALWAFLASLPVAAVIGPMMDPSPGAKGGFACCPSCGKSVFLLHGWTTGRWTFAATLWWPERECSECLHDLSEADTR
jgi:hypothetical protein